ncbi:MAG: alpha-L-fucosidase [Bacteroidales bacterium]|nr:alpha-L-fucosidase [Bacteroidales bacterium]
MRKILALAAAVFMAAAAQAQDAQSTQEMKINYIAPEEEAVREHVARWQDYKFGMFIHWGVYSELGVVESWSLVPQAVSWMYRARRERGMSYNEYVDFYNNLYRSFNPTQFDPSKWAEAASYAGMKYVVFTTKHHDGFCMFDTQATDYKITSPNCPYSRSSAHPNIAKELFQAFRDKGIKPGAYFSIADWHHQDYWWDFFPPRSTKINYPAKEFPEKWERFQDFLVQQVSELTDGTYGDLEMLWFDLGHPSDDDSAEVPWDRMAAAARASQPDIMMVARGTGGKHENYKTPEQTIPEQPLDCPWESCITMTGSWSYRPGWGYKSTREILNILVKVVSRGGSLLLNVGPRPDGTLEDEAYERLHEIGDWMQVNSEAIYATKAWSTCQDGKVCFTAKDKTVYAFYMAENGEDVIPAEISFSGVIPGGEVRMLGYDKPLRWKKNSDGGISVTIPQRLRDKLPCRDVWVLRMNAAQQQ